MMRLLVVNMVRMQEDVPAFPFMAALSCYLANPDAVLNLLNAALRPLCAVTNLPARFQLLCQSWAGQDKLALYHALSNRCLSKSSKTHLPFIVLPASYCNCTMLAHLHNVHAASGLAGSCAGTLHLRA